MRFVRLALLYRLPVPGARLLSYPPASAEVFHSQTRKPVAEWKISLLPDVNQDRQISPRSYCQRLREKISSTHEIFSL